MIAVRLISRAELEKRLAPYKCKFVTHVSDDVELWVTGWNYPFTLWSQAGHYEEDQYRRLLAAVIANTMPADWNANGD